MTEPDFRALAARLAAAAEPLACGCYRMEDRVEMHRALEAARLAGVWDVRPDLAAQMAPFRRVYLQPDAPGC